MRTSIYVKTSFKGMHQWSNIPVAHPEQHLRFPHRHQFFVKATIEVKHDDRELELYVVQDELDAYINVMQINGTESCEELAKYLAIHLLQEYGERKVTVDVSEDDQRGAIYEN